jgi:membrane protein
MVTPQNKHLKNDRPATAPENAPYVAVRPDHAPCERKRKRLRNWAFQFKNNESSLSALTRTILRILYIMASEFETTAIPLRASALSYSVLLSLIPVLAMSTAVLKGLGSDNQLKIAAYRLINQLEPTVPAPEQPKMFPESAREQGQKTESIGLADHLRKSVDTIFAYVDRTNFATLGIFGIVGLLFAVVLVFGTIESAMNVIWHSSRGRPLLRKIMDYLALLILLPISINVALAGDAILASPKMLAILHTMIPAEGLIRIGLKLLPFLFVVLTLMVMYLFFPNVRVKTSAALIGALFASLFWFLVQRLYLVLQIGVAKYNAIYGSFATLPLFLIWVQLGWTFILLGASLAYAIQNHHFYQPPGSRRSAKQQLQLAFDILKLLYNDFAEKKTTSIERLVHLLPQEAPSSLQEILEKLIAGGLIHRVERDEPIFVPVAPSDAFESKKVVRLFLGSEEIPTHGGSLATLVVQAAEEAIAKDAFLTNPSTDTL